MQLVLIDSGFYLWYAICGGAVGKDYSYPYACQPVAMSTLLSIVTMPLILTLGGMIL